MTQTATRLKRILGALEGLSDPVRSAQAAALGQRLAMGRVRVLLVGEAKRGKSTLGNALLGREVLPSAVLPLTSITTTVREGSPERVEVSLHDGSSSVEPLSELASLVTEAGNPHNRKGVASVVVFVTDGFANLGVELVDTPGAGSVFEQNSVEADRALNSMDTAIFVLTADPPISATEREMLGEVDRLAVRMVIALNKVDRLSADERNAAELFTREVVAETTGSSEVTLFGCSARAGLQARLSSDAQAWSASGVAALSAALEEDVRQHGRQDLYTSLALSAARLASRMLDEANVTVRTRELLAQQRHEQTRSFAARLAAMGTRGEEALAVARGEAATVRRELDASASDAVGRLSQQALVVLERSVGPAELSQSLLEGQGMTELRTIVRAGVDAWREEWSKRLDSALRAMTQRQQELLDDAVADVRDAARISLGLDLQASPEAVTLPTVSSFYYTLDPEGGWNEPLLTGIRRRLPGPPGRRWVMSRLRAEAPRLVSKHVGRARSDFQMRLEDALRQLASSVRTGFAEHSQGLGAAVAAASDSGTSALPDRSSSDPGAGAASDVALQRRIATLTALLDDLRYLAPGSDGGIST